MYDTDAARNHLLGPRRGTVEATLACADHVAETWEGDGTEERAAVSQPFERLLSDSGLLESYPAVLAECVTAVGASLRSEPVPAPPYVVLTSTGVLLRATLEGGRLVAGIEPFAVEHDGVTRYVRRAETPEAAVSVSLR